jgi:hypothetical protein
LKTGFLNRLQHKALQSEIVATRLDLRRRLGRRAGAPFLPLRRRQSSFSSRRRTRRPAGRLFRCGGGPGRKAVAASPICEQQIGQMRV